MSLKFVCDILYFCFLVIAARLYPVEDDEANDSVYRVIVVNLFFVGYTLVKQMTGVLGAFMVILQQCVGMISVYLSMLYLEIDLVVDIYLILFVMHSIGNIRFLTYNLVAPKPVRKSSDECDRMNV
jgi:hypothetical protein